MTEFLLLHMCQFLIKLKIFHVCYMCNISFVLSFLPRILQCFVSLTLRCNGSKTLKDRWWNNETIEKLHMRQTYSEACQWCFRQRFLGNTPQVLFSFSMILPGEKRVFLDTKIKYKLKVHTTNLSKFHLERSLSTPPIAEIICIKNVGAIVVCGFLMKLIKKQYPENMKKIAGAVWELPAK